MYNFNPEMILQTGTHIAKKTPSRLVSQMETEPNYKKKSPHTTEARNKRVYLLSNYKRGKPGINPPIYLI